MLARLNHLAQTAFRLSRTIERPWVAQTGVSPLPAAFPGLHEFTVHGGDEMTFRVRDGRLTPRA